MLWPNEDDAASVGTEYDDAATDAASVDEPLLPESPSSSMPSLIDDSQLDMVPESPLDNNNKDADDVVQKQLVNKVSKFPLIAKDAQVQKDIHEKGPVSSANLVKDNTADVNSNDASSTQVHKDLKIVSKFWSDQMDEDFNEENLVPVNIDMAENVAQDFTVVLSKSQKKKLQRNNRKAKNVDQYKGSPRSDKKAYK